MLHPDAAVPAQNDEIMLRGGGASLTGVQAEREAQEQQPLHGASADQRVRSWLRPPGGQHQTAGLWFTDNEVKHPQSSNFRPLSSLCRLPRVLLYTILVFCFVLFFFPHPPVLFFSPTPLRSTVSPFSTPL